MPILGSQAQGNFCTNVPLSLAMSLDRTLPKLLGSQHRVRGTSINAILASSCMVFVVLLLVPDVAAASLIFLVSFALAHWDGTLRKCCAS
ncbi:hypothetical protein ACFL4N_10120 [Thermodesulfobacteriota bacterium]